MQLGCTHEENDVKRTSRDESRDFNQYVSVTESFHWMNHALSRSFNVGGSSGDPYAELSSATAPAVSITNDSSIFRPFFE